MFNPMDLLKIGPFVPVVVRIVKAVKAAGEDGKYTLEEVVKIVASGLADLGKELVKILPGRKGEVVREFLDLIPELADVILIVGAGRVRQALASLRHR